MWDCREQLRNKCGPGALLKWRSVGNIPGVDAPPGASDSQDFCVSVAGRERRMLAYADASRVPGWCDVDAQESREVRSAFAEEYGAAPELVRDKRRLPGTRQRRQKDSRVCH